MAVRTLSDGELQRLRYELGFNVVGIGAEPYIDHAQIPSTIQSYLFSDVQAVAYSATAVTTPGSVDLHLDCVTGISQGTPVVIDCDDSFERVTVKKVNALESLITVNCKRLHGTPFPVEIESGLSMVRVKLWTLASLEGRILDAADAAGLKSVDEVVFQDAKATSVLATLLRQQQVHRRELASLVNLNDVLSPTGSNAGFALY